MKESPSGGSFFYFKNYIQVVFLVLYLTLAMSLLQRVHSAAQCEIVTALSPLTSLLCGKQLGGFFMS